MASGPAGETSVLLSAGLSLMVFVLYFVSILVAVPKHWGVPYKDRLSRYLARSRSGLAVEALNACFSLATCVLFVLETYSYGSDYDFIVLSFSLEMVFNGFFLCNFILHLYLALDKLIHLVSLQALVDIVTVFPSYLILFVNDGWRTSDGGFADAYLGLKITRVIRVARLLVAISFFAQGPSLAFDHSRQILVLRSQLLRWSLKTAVVIFLLAGLSNFLVEVQDADWGTGEGTMPFHDALYFVIVSFSTVGYGDISPSTPLSRLVITGLILTLFFCVPVVTNAIYDVIRLRPKHGGRLPKHRGTGHVVVGCDASCLRQISILLKDLLSADSMAYHNAHVVLVVPQEPTLAWEALLCLQPSSAVSYLNGDLRSAEDLRRARVQDARCVFVVSDRLAPDTEAQDKTALVRALCANQASPPGGPSVLCLVTHIKSKNRLVRLGMPSASVVCYDEVMEELVTNACLNPGFSTVWANLMSCNPEAEFLLKAREADIEASRGPESTVVYETEMEYLRSLQRVTIRFRLDAFAGEPVGDVTIELYENCSCTLFALIGAVVGSDGHEGGAKGGGGKRGGRRRARVHPEYDTVVKEGDVGVFIGASHKTADLLARYCMGRGPSGQDSARRGRSESMLKTTIASKQGVSRSGARGPGGGSGSGSGSGSGGGDGPVVASLNSSSSVDESLVATPPGVVLVIAQSLSYALGVVLALCEAGAGCGSEGSDGIPTSNSTVSVLCSTVWWDPADDMPAERELASRFPGVRLVKQEVDCRSLTAVGAGTADLVCVVASRPEEDAPAALTLGGGGLGESIGRGQGSDAWALGVAVDVLGLVPESTRVVVRFDDSTSAEQHQVVSAHVRRRTDARGTAGRDGRAAGDGGGEEKGEGEEERAQPGVGAQPEGTRPATGPAAAAAAAGAPHSDLSPRETAGQSNASALAPRKWSAGMLVEDSEFFGDWVGGVSEACGAGGEVYFDDTRGAVHEGFDDYFGTQSGYVSGDVVIGNAAELLLLQTMLAPDVQSLMGDALSLVSRVAIENLWPQHHPFGARSTPARSRARPQTYGAAYRSLLEERDLLALGIHRPPARRGDGSAATSDGRRTCPGGSRYVAINCPDASFALRDGDFIFVLRRTTSRSVSKGAVAPKVGR